jgi:hypothetical protein
VSLSIDNVTHAPKIETSVFSRLYTRKGVTVVVKITSDIAILVNRRLMADLIGFFRYTIRHVNVLPRRLRNIKSNAKALTTALSVRDKLSLTFCKFNPLADKVEFSK